MTLIHHVVNGAGSPALVLVHGFGCDHTDYAAQVAHFSAPHRCVAVDLRGHGETPGRPEDCAIERFGGDVAEVLRSLDLRGAVLVGHSLGGRVVVEAALQAPDRVGGVVLLDASQFAPGADAMLKAQFAKPDGFAELANNWFRDMFTAKSDPQVVAAAVARAGRITPAIGTRLMLDLQRYDVTRFTASLGCLRVPVLALQSTFSNEKRERRPMAKGQITPFLEMVRGAVPGARIEVIADTGHFPQLDEPAATNAALEAFLATLR